MAYTDSFEYLCRKDGVERKYLIFKGESYPECTLLHEQATTQPNGVRVSVILKDNYSEFKTCIGKIKTQLAYLDNVFYNIEGFENSYKVFRTDLFQYSTLRGSDEMHISLKNISYPIDWAKLNMRPIYVPIALRFDTYDEIKPIFNRESLQYNNETIQAIQHKMVKAATWLVDKWNENADKYETIQDAIPAYRYKKFHLELFKHKEQTHSVQVDLLEGVCLNRIEMPKVVGIKLKSPEFYIKMLPSLCKMWTAIAFIKSKSRNKWQYKNLQGCIHSSLTSLDHYKVVLIDFKLTGHIKEFLNQKFSSDTVFVKRHTQPMESVLFDVINEFPADKYAEDKKGFLNELSAVIRQIESSFEDQRGLNESKEYIDWLQNKKDHLKALAKQGMVKASTALYKEQGEVTVYKARVSERGSNIVFDKTKQRIKDIKPPHGLIVYTDANTDMPDHVLKAFISHPKIQFCKFNTREIKHFKNVKNYVTMEQFTKMRPLARLATALYIKNVLQLEPNNVDLVEEAFPALGKLKEELKDYVSRHNISNTNVEINRLIVEDAKATNNWDFNIYHKVEEYVDKIKPFAFMSQLKDISSWRTTNEEKAVIRNMMYIMLKHYKVNCAFVEEFTLTPVEKPVEEQAAVIA